MWALFRQLCSAVVYAHKRRIIRCDPKSENVLLDERRSNVPVQAHRSEARRVLVDICA